MSEAYYTNEFIFRFKKDLNFFILLPAGYARHKISLDLPLIYIAPIDDDSMIAILNETIRETTEQ